MTKAELVEKVADKIQLTKKQTEAVVNILLNCITEARVKGIRLSCVALGVFGSVTAILAKGAIPKPVMPYRFQRSGCRSLRLEKNSVRWLTVQPVSRLRPEV